MVISRSDLTGVLEIVEHESPADDVRVGFVAGVRGGHPGRQGAGRDQVASPGGTAGRASGCWPTRHRQYEADPRHRQRARTTTAFGSSACAGLGKHRPAAARAMFTDAIGQRSGESLIGTSTLWHGWPFGEGGGILPQQTGAPIPATFAAEENGEEDHPRMNTKGCIYLAGLACEPCITALFVQATVSNTARKKRDRLNKFGNGDADPVSAGRRLPEVARHVRGVVIVSGVKRNEPLTTDNPHENPRIPGPPDPLRNRHSRSARPRWSLQPEEAAIAFKKFGGQMCVVKAQVYAGGPRQGGVRQAGEDPRRKPARPPSSC